MKKRRVAGIVAGVAGTVILTTGSILPFTAYASEDMQKSESVVAKTVEKNGTFQIQISDSDFNEINGVKVEVVAEPEGGKAVKKTEVSRTSDDFFVGGERINSFIEIDTFNKKTRYTLHFIEVPAGYEKPNDIVFVRDIVGESAKEEIVSSGNAVMEVNRALFDKINLCKAGENIDLVRWMSPQMPLPENVFYYVGKDGNKYTGWHYMTEKEGISPSAWMYFDNNVGCYYTGWKWMDGEEGQKTPHWSYFGEDGKLRTGWQQMGQGTSNPDGNHPRHWSYFGENGWLRTGWKEMGKGTSNPDGNHPKHMSYFGDNGWLREGWQQMGRGTSNPDGNNPWHMSYFGDNGWLRTGWKEMGKGTSNPDGNHPKHWSYFGENGWLRTGWKEMGQGTSNPDGNHPKHWSYFGPNGWLRTYWQEMGKGTSNPDGNHPRHRSYFGDNGWLRTGKQNIDGKVYVFTDTGWLKK